MKLYVISYPLAIYNFSALISIAADLILSSEVSKSYVMRKIELVSHDFHVERIPR